MSGTLSAAPPWLRLLLYLATAAFLAGWPGLAYGGSPAASTHVRQHHVPTVQNGRCVQAVNRTSGDILINSCNECRLVQITYRRPNNDFPLHRSYRLRANARMDLSFKGTGQTRVMNDSPCDPAPIETSDGHKDCAKLVRGKDGRPTLANACPVCRGIVIERVGADGLRRRQTLALTGLSMVPIPALGAAGVRIVTEMECPGK